MTGHITNCKNCGSNQLVDNICLHCGTNYGKPIIKYNPHEISDSLGKFIIQIKNPTNKTLKAVLFGYNDNYLLKNYGSDEGLIIESFEKYSYQGLLLESNVSPFVIHKYRFISSTQKQLYQSFEISETNIMTGKPDKEIIQLSIYNDVFQSCATSIDVNRPVKIDGNVSLSLNILPVTTLSIIGFCNVIKCDVAKPYVVNNDEN